MTSAGGKTWIYRYRSPVTGRNREMGLGSLTFVSLADARVKAEEPRRMVLSGLDPIAARDSESRLRGAEAVKSITFSKCAGDYIERQKPGWKNKKHAEQWTATIETYLLEIGEILKSDNKRRPHHRCR